MKLNRSNPLTKGLLYAKSFGNIYAPDSVKNVKPTIVDFTSNISESTRYGSLKYMDCTGLSGDYYDSGISPTWASGDHITIAMLVRNTDTTAMFMGQRDGATVSWQFFTNNATGNGNFFWNTGNESSRLIGTTEGLAIDGKWHMIHVRALFGTNVQLFVDGVDDSAGPETDTRTPSAGAVPLSIGTRWNVYPTTAFEGEIDIAFAGVWNRRLTEAEIASHAKNPWQMFIDSSRPIIGAHQLSENVNFAYAKREYQGSNGYTIDFAKDHLSPHPYGTFGTDTEVQEYGTWAVSGQDEWRTGPNYLRSDDTTHIPFFGLAPNKFKFGPWQFCEVDVYIPVTSQQTDNVWAGPAVFIAGMRNADSGWSATNCYAILVYQCGGGTATYRLYKRRSNTWFPSSSEGGPADATGMPDCASQPVRLRLEAMDNGSSTVVRWFINGNEQPTWDDTNAFRVRYMPGVNGQANLSYSYVGASWGSGNAQNATLRRIVRLRGGNMPEIKTEIEPLPINEDLPDLVTFEKPWEKQPK